jgi:hypothetical protein
MDVAQRVWLSNWHLVLLLLCNTVFLLLLLLPQDWEPLPLLQCRDVKRKHPRVAWCAVCSCIEPMAGYSNRTGS